MFVAQSGTDPGREISRIAQSLAKSDLVSISLGRGQDQRAEEAISSGKLEGKWIILHNCHLSPSFMAVLERKVFESTECDKHYRLWLTTLPTPAFPPNVLQDSVKLAWELPKGIKQNMLMCSRTLTAEMLDIEEDKQSE